MSTPAAAPDTSGESVRAYLNQAILPAITDALSDLMEAERRARENSRLISRGFVRSAAPRW